jgi:hypothetical protein
MLTVSNRNNFDFQGRYNGVDYHFPQGKTVAVPDDAAKHIFGVGLADKVDVLVRHGWMSNAAARDTAMAKLNNFSFNVAEQLNPGEIIETEIAEPKVESVVEQQEQGSAPLQTGSGGDEQVPDGAEEEPPQPTSSKGSILDEIKSFIQR